MSQTVKRVHQGTLMTSLSLEMVPNLHLQVVPTRGGLRRQGKRLVDLGSLTANDISVETLISFNLVTIAKGIRKI